MEHFNEFIRLTEDAKGRIREITPETLKEWLESDKSFHLVDVREDNEWKGGHIEGAIHLSKGIIERDIMSSIKRIEDEIVLYCSGGFRSALAADSIQKMGYSQVYSLKGGYKAWVASQSRP